MSAVSFHTTGSREAQISEQHLKAAGVIQNICLKLEITRQRQIQNSVFITAVYKKRDSHHQVYINERDSKQSSVTAATVKK